MTFSSRLHWDLRLNPLTERLRVLRGSGARILDLTESNPTKAGLDYPAQAILGALADARVLTYDPTPLGLAAAREAVAAYYAPRGHDVDPERILLTASTSEAYAYLFKLLADPGDQILAPRPSYPLFEFLAALESVHIVQYPLFYHDGWHVDFGALERTITQRSRAVVVVNPNNPTGSFLKRAELGQLAALCRARKLAIISDEVFSDYGFGADPQRAGTVACLEDAPAFVLSGLSKIAALPQMKLGWMVATGGGWQQALERLELIADTYLSVATPVQVALPRLLELSVQVRRQISARTVRNLEFLRSRLGADSPASLLEVEGGWYATLQVPRIRGEEEWVLDLLDRDGVLVQPGFFYDFESEAFLVLSLLTDPAIFEEGVRRLLARAAR